MTITSNSTAQHSEARISRPLLVRLTVAACLLFWIFVFADSGWGPIIVPLSIQLDASLTVTGLFYVVWSLGYLPGALIGGAMLDRYGPRRVLSGASLIVLGGFFCIYVGMLLPHIIPLITLLVISGLGGVGGGIIDASTNGLISGIYTERRGMALNLFNLLYPLGGVIVALTDAGLLRLFHNDPRPCFIFTMCFTVGAMISLLGIPKNFRIVGDTSTISKNERSRSKESTLELVKILAPVILVMMLTSGISSSIRTWTPAYLHVAYAQTPAIAAALSSITWIIAAGSRLGAAFLILRIGSWRMVMLGLIITLFGLVALMFSSNAVTATLAIALTSIGLSPIFATCLAIGSERAGRSFGSVAGILLFVSGISTVFSGWFFGFLLNTSGPIWPVIYCFVFVLLGGIFAVRLRPAY
jgi:MFS transporter, FHS family, glucose/mannose:H+ symporter